MSESEKYFIEEVVIKQQKYHSSKAGKFKTKANYLKLITIVLSALIPFSIVVFKGYKELSDIIIATLGCFLFIFEGVKSQFKYEENWRLYRDTSERLKNELRTYKVHAAPYSTDERFNTLVNKVNFILTKTVNDWLLTNKESKNKEAK